MKLYIRCSSAYISDDEIVERFLDDGLSLTANPNNAIYILRDGRMIQGIYQGIRSEDHRCAECLFDDIDRYDPHFWDKLLEATNMVILHPEIEKAVIGRGQQITWEQQEVIDQLGYDLSLL